MDILEAAYERCRQIHRRNGRSYYLATRLLPAWKQRHVHALYGFTRYADEIVDGMRPLREQERARRLACWSAGLHAGLAGQERGSPVPVERAGFDQDGGAVLLAVSHTIRVFDLDTHDFAVFLDSMAMDLTVTSYRTYDDLLGYMAGSAAVIGTMTLPILQAPSAGPAVDLAATAEPARELGIAFQLTNFVRDVAEDLDRGRVYLPVEDLDSFGIERADLLAARRAGHSTPAIRELMGFEVARAREHYARAEIGIGMLEATSRPCVRAAFRLYLGILDEIERNGLDVFSRRAVVSQGRRFRLVAGALLARPSALGRQTSG
jgi:15-cis-phytoene synthase